MKGNQTSVKFKNDPQNQIRNNLYSNLLRSNSDEAIQPENYQPFKRYQLPERTKVAAAQPRLIFTIDNVTNGCHLNVNQ